MEKENESFEVTASRGKLHIRFPSFLKYIDQTCTVVGRFLASKQEGIDPHMFAINLILREGLTNAVRHGNKNDPDKLVDVQLEIDRGNRIIIKIADQGDGFDWKKQQCPLVPEEADHGRGIRIMETYSTRYSYNSKGNLLCLEKVISPNNLTSL